MGFPWNSRSYRTLIRRSREARRLGLREMGRQVGAPTASNYYRYEHTKQGTRRDMDDALADRVAMFLGFHDALPWFRALVAYTHSKERGTADEIAASRYRLDVHTARMENQERASTGFVLSEPRSTSQDVQRLMPRHRALRRELTQFTARTNDPRKFLGLTLGSGTTGLADLHQLLDDTRHLVVAAASRGRASGPTCVLHLECFSLTRGVEVTPHSPGEPEVYVQSYDSAVRFLDAWLEARPDAVSRLARAAGLDETTIRRRRHSTHLTPYTQQRIARAMVKMGEFCRTDKVDDVAFFGLLAARDRAGPQELPSIDAEIRTVRNLQAGRARLEAATEVMGDWVCAAVGELVRWRPSTALQLGDALRPTVAPQHLESALQRMVDGGFLVVRGEQYLPTATPPVVFRHKRGEGELHRAFHAYHLAMRREAEARTREAWVDPVRAIHSVLLPIAPERFSSFVDILTRARDRALALSESLESSSRRVVQVNLHLAPLGEA